VHSFVIFTNVAFFLWKELLNFCLEGGKLEAGRREVLEVERMNYDLTTI